MAQVKICGITNLPDALVCVEAGAQFLGFNFYQKSPRFIEPGFARLIIEKMPSEVQTVGIFVNEKSPADVLKKAKGARFQFVQLHGDESPEFCETVRKHFPVIKAFRVSDEFQPEILGEFPADAYLLDSFNPKLYGGSGERFDWKIAANFRENSLKNLFLAGGISAKNVVEAIKTVQPFAVDVCSALETEPGRKSERKVKEFMRAVLGVNND